MHHILCVLHGSKRHAGERIHGPRTIRRYLCGQLSHMLAAVMGWCGLQCPDLINIMSKVVMKYIFLPPVITGMQFISCSSFLLF